MESRNISRFTCMKLDELQEGARTVLYEEMAEYFYLFARKQALRKSSIRSEVDYHIGNLVLMSLYFDVVLIQTATIFNSTDPFIRKVIDGVLIHSTFRGMLEAGVIKIVGWGGNSPKEMFEAAESFSKSASPSSRKGKHTSIIASLFDSQSTVSRAPGTPDAGIEILFKNRLEQTTIIRRPSDVEAVDYALSKSMERTGQLVAVSFNPELSKLELTTESMNAVALSFIQSWHDHLSSEIPGVVTYAPMTDPIFIDQKISTSENTIRTFLYSPQIFASFLSGYLRPKDFNEILKHPFQELVNVKNGDWKRFADAYHDAVRTVSENIGHLGHSLISAQDFSDQGLWSTNLSEAIEKSSDKVDVNAFIESLAMLSGVVFTVPFLGPIFKSAGVVMGKRVNETFHVLRKNATTDISPFIQKLLKHYDLEGVRA